jgi:hypothetical protein
MPRKYRKKQGAQETSQIDRSQQLRWTDCMVHAALDEAIQQDQLGKRAGQGFKAEALILITAAAQKKVEHGLGIELTTIQLDTKLDTASPELAL